MIVDMCESGEIGTEVDKEGEFVDVSGELGAKIMGALDGGDRNESDRNGST